MATTSLTAGEVMDAAASLMNDTAQTVYTYVVQLPYLNMAIDELREYMELNNTPVSNETSAIIEVDVGETAIVSVTASTTQPNYPTNMVEIQQLWERLQGSSEPYIPMYHREFLPHYLDDIPVTNLVYWSWINQEIRFIGATTDRDVKLDYIQEFLAEAADEDSVIGIINAKSYLQYKTAALCSSFIGENPTRSAELNGLAELAKERVLGIGTKGRQDIITRRKPFLASYKMRTS